MKTTIFLLSTLLALACGRAVEEGKERKTRQLGFLFKDLRGLGSTIMGSDGILANTLGGVSNTVRGVNGLSSTALSGLDGNLQSVSKFTNGFVGDLGNYSGRLLGRSVDGDSKKKPEEGKDEKPKEPKNAKEAEKMKEKEEQKAE